MYTAFKDILTSDLAKFANNERIKAFRQTIDTKYLNTTREEYLATGSDIYKLFSGLAAHKITVIVPLPSRYDIEGIKTMYQSFGIVPTPSKIIFVQILLDEFATFHIPDDPTISTTLSP